MRGAALLYLQEEDRIIVAEVAGLKRGLGDRTLTGKRLREYLVRIIYVEMLGHDASFGYMKAVEVSLCTRSSMLTPLLRTQLRWC